MKLLSDRRGEGELFTVFTVAALFLLLSLLLTVIGTETRTNAIRRAVTDEMAALEYRITADTYRAVREGDLADYERILLRSQSYREALLRTAEEHIAENCPLQTEYYELESPSLSFEREGEGCVRYTLSFQLSTYVTFLGIRGRIRTEDISLSAVHTLTAVPD